MEVFNFEENRQIRKETASFDLVIAGGGITGVCCAITAAREGLSVALIQDRPVLGGNASSEVRLWILGATSHMGNNNRWAREGGVINEILVENTFRNKEGNPVLFDMLLIDKVLSEKNITLYLNTIVLHINKSSADRIEALYAFCASNETSYEFRGKLFVDCTGDGIVSYLAGVPYRIGAETKDEYKEAFAPNPIKYGELLGHSIFFYMKDTGAPVSYVAPSFALKEVERHIPKVFKNEYFNTGHHGCKYWWLEYGGRLDTIHDTETIKYELWKVIYGLWDYIKNSGKFPETVNYTLEWAGLMPGKRESRRFKGLYTLTQQDIIEQHFHEDAVAFGGWALDLHSADAVYSAMRGCDQYHAKGIYSIPYRCYLPEKVDNLFLGGRLISVSHVAFASTRVMATCAHGGQAIGMAASISVKRSIDPQKLLLKEYRQELQEKLNITGQSIPQLPINGHKNLVLNSTISTSSFYRLEQIPSDGKWMSLNYSAAQLLPLKAGQIYSLEIEVKATATTCLTVELRCSSKAANYTPDTRIEQLHLKIKDGEQRVAFSFTRGLPEDQYGFITFLKNEHIMIRTSEKRYTGILSVCNKFNIAVNNYGKQSPPENCGLESFEFWCPERRPEGKNMAMKIHPPLPIGDMLHLQNGYTRPARSTNAWIASDTDTDPTLTYHWNTPQTFREIILFFDTDFDHPMESVQMGHTEAIIPFCVREYTISCMGKTIHRITDNHETIDTILLEEPLTTTTLEIKLKHPSCHIPASLFYVYIR